MESSKFNQFNSIKSEIENDPLNGLKNFAQLIASKKVDTNITGPNGENLLFSIVNSIIHNVATSHESLLILYSLNMNFMRRDKNGKLFFQQGDLKLHESRHLESFSVFGAIVGSACSNNRLDLTSTFEGKTVHAEYKEMLES